MKKSKNLYYPNNEHLIGEKCVFIEYQNDHVKGRMVILLEWYNKQNKKIMAKLKGCIITFWEMREFTNLDIDFIKKGSV